MVGIDDLVALLAFADVLAVLLFETGLYRFFFF
jgi:hypothetical protein